MDNYKLCIIKPNKSSYSETFIQAHINHLKGEKRVLYGGAFPLYNHNHKYLISNKFQLFSYLIQKRVFKKLDIFVRTKALAYYLQKENFQLVFAEYGYVGAMVAEACKLAGTPLIIHFHGADAHHRATVNKYKSLYKNAFEYASSIVVVSNDMRSSLISLGANPDKLILNPYGVNPNFFKLTDVLNSGINFLSIGRFVPKKSPNTTIKAFKKVIEKFPDAHLWMVGDGPLLKEAKLLSQSLGLAKVITFTGVLTAEEIVNLMQTTRCFVQHSVTAFDGDMEGTPNTILEASAAGLPIVSTKHAGIKEAVIDGKTGFLVDEHDEEAMGEKMLELAASSELAARLGKNAREHIMCNYNMSVQISKLDKLIEDIILKNKS